MSEKVCINHTDREAESLCISCFKPICNECIIRYKGHDYCSDKCAEGAENTGAIINEISAGQSRIRKKKVFKKILLLIFLIIISIFLYLFVFKNENIMKIFKAKAEEVKGAVLARDDFYHAKGGVWEMETTIHLLKSRKFVSSNNELKKYLVYTVKPGERVRMVEAIGRWKKLDLMKEGEIQETGWADAEDGRAKWISDLLVEE